MKKFIHLSKAIDLGFILLGGVLFIMTINIWAKANVLPDPVQEIQTESSEEPDTEEEIEVDIPTETPPIIESVDNTVMAPPPVVEEPTDEFVSVSYIPEYIQKLCYEIGEEYGIEPGLLIAIIERESSGRVNAVNKKTGCMGLMQLHPKYADYYLKKAGCSDPFNAEHNIRAGCEILKEKTQQYKHLPLVLMKYHGESNATKKYKTGNYSSYCKTILARMEEIKEINNEKK